MSVPIQVENLFFSYNESPIIDNASFVVNQGEFIGVIGPNGGGKTTLIRLLLGLLTPQKGKILIDGHPPKAGLGSMAYVPQTLRFDRLFPISVLEMVLMGLLSKLPWYGRYSHEDKKKALEALRLMQLEHKANSPVGSLSTGQLQRALIARALVCDPQILLLDEPTASVDQSSEEMIYQILNSLKGSKTILMVTHDLDAIISQFERVICVQTQVSTLEREAVCEHFAIGLYHKPLVQLSGGK